MQKKFISRQCGCRRLLLIYAGWGMDWRPFRELSLPGYDIMVLWDYRDLTFNWKPLMAYDEVCLVAWSMGVFAASVTIHELLPRITKRIAINGTLDPIHDSKGIPSVIYHGTINALSPSTLRKFYRRMCMNADEFEAFRANQPKRTIAELSEELRAIETHYIFHVPQVREWDLAVVSRHDAIFPTQNQVTAWRQLAPIQFMEAAHLPDFRKILPRLFIDKDRVRARFANAAATYSAQAKAQHAIAAALFRRFRQNSAPSAMDGNILEVGCGDGTLTRLFAPLVHPLSVVRLWDLAGDKAPEGSPGNAIFENCDAETAIRRLPAASQAVIFSASTIQWFNSPASFLRQCRRVLISGGYLVLSTFVLGNLKELTELAGSGLQLPMAEGWRRMLPEGMEPIVCDVAPQVLTFAEPREVLEHLRDTGVNAVDFGRNGAALARKLLEEYPRQADSSCTLTYMPVYMIVRKQDL